MRVLLLGIAGIAVVIGSFFVTLWLIDEGPFSPASNPLGERPIAGGAPDAGNRGAKAPQPDLSGYDVAKFVRIGVNDAVKINNQQNAGALISGWSTPEAWGVWSDGPVAEIGIVPQNMSGKDLIIQVAYDVFTAPPQLPKQKIEVWSAAIKLQEFELAQSGTISVSLAALRLQNGSPMVLRFRFPNATSPADVPTLKSSDTRKLAIGLIGVRLTEK